MTVRMMNPKRAPETHKVNKRIIDPEVLSSLRRRIAQSAEKSGRREQDITLIAVTKSFPVSAMESAISNGIGTLGESRIQETEEKIPRFSQRDDVELHLIGHLQSNKARKAVDLFDVIQSVDSLKLAGRLNQICAEKQSGKQIFLQVNTGQDPNKFGITPEEAINTALEIHEMGHIKLEGLMMIAPATREEKILRDTFSSTRDLCAEIHRQGAADCTSISMGMSEDFEIAIEEGATHIRLGRALFGKRP